MCIISSDRNCKITEVYTNCIYEGTNVKSEATLALVVTARDEGFLDALDLQ
jgi:hypothetical protein